LIIPASSEALAERLFLHASVVLSALAVAGGCGLAGPLGFNLRSGYRLTDDIFQTTHLAVMGLLVVIGGL
jgi:hypothetical protein